MDGYAVSEWMSRCMSELMDEDDIYRVHCNSVMQRGSGGHHILHGQVESCTVWMATLLVSSQFPTLQGYKVVEATAPSKLEGLHASAKLFVYLDDVVVVLPASQGEEAAKVVEEVLGRYGLVVNDKTKAWTRDPNTALPAACRTTRAKSTSKHKSK